MPATPGVRTARFSLILATVCLAQESDCSRALWLIGAGSYLDARDSVITAIRALPIGTPPCHLALLLVDQAIAEYLLTRPDEAVVTLTRANDLCAAFQTLSSALRSP